MERDAAVQEGLRRSNARFLLSMSRILEKYNHPFEDDLLVSMDDLTYDTPDGPKRWGEVSRKDIKKWKREIFEHNRRSRRNTETSKQQSSDFEDEHSTVEQESSENSVVDISDTDGESGDRVSVRRKFEDNHLQNLNVDDGEIQKKERVQLDVIVQADYSDLPEWITITPPSSSKGHRLTSPVREHFGGESGDIVSVRRKFEDIHLQNLNVDDGEIQKKERVQLDVIVQADHSNLPKWITITPPSSSKGHRITSPVREHFGGESGDIVSVRRKFEDIHLQNLNVDDGEIQKKERVQLDVIVQADHSDLPKWITITPPSSSKGHRLTSPLQEQFGNQAAVYRKKLELSNGCSSSKYLQLQHSGAPFSSTTIASSSYQPCPELSSTFYDSIHGEYQSADEEGSWSNTTLADLYPAMLEVFTKLMTKHSQKKVLKYMFGHLRSKRRHSRRPKLNVTLDKMRRLRPSVQKSTCGFRSEDNQSSTSGNESREFSCDNCLISNSPDLMPYAYTDTNEIKTGYSNSSLEHLAPGKGQEVRKHAAFHDVMDRMGETFLVEDELHTTASPKNSEYTENEKFDYKRLSETTFIIPTASSDSRALHVVEESETQKTDCVGTSELRSSACSSPGNSNNSILPITNCSPARSSNTTFPYPQEIISESPTSFHHKGSFSFGFMKQSPSKMPEKCKDAFEELYYKVCSEEFQKSLTLKRPCVNSQNLEEKGRLVKSNLTDFGRSAKQCDIEFDRIYEKLRGESVPKFPGFQRASNFRKYENIQMPETVNALVNSPVRAYSAISRVKRTGSFQNYLLCSPVKRPKLTPGHCFSAKKCQEISPSKNLQTAGMDFLSTCNCSNPRFFADHNCHCQGSGSHYSSDESSLDIPVTSLQESGTAGVHPGCPGAMENCNSLRNVRKCHQRVYRKLSYTDEKDQL